jgi:ATP-dependent RNA helicase DDX54/DBP10
LALQTIRFTRELSKFQNLRACLLVGGDSMGDQFAALSQNPDIIIATPGRLLHHMSEVESFTLALCEIVIFDEADRMFEMGFEEQASAVF